MAESADSDKEPEEVPSEVSEEDEEKTDEVNDTEEAAEAEAEGDTPAEGDETDEDLEPEVAEEESEAEETPDEDEQSDEVEDLETSLREGGADAEDEQEEEEEDEEPVKPVLKHEGRFYGTGRRKESVARVWIEAGSGDFTVNDRDGEAYFQHRQRWLQEVHQPLECVDFDGDVDVWATLEGGGLTGQAGALQLGLARALVEMDENARPWLKEEGLLTRDDRMVERKKINQPGARAKQQVSKR